ncbi:MAG: putative ABC transport system permease protein [Verrucomicrobiales bacterium]|jgi:putative ABC transport system permease protein
MRLWYEITENLRIALESVRTNKLRSFLATLGIVIGVFTAILMATAITGLGKAFENSISAIGSDVIYIQRFSWGPSEKWWKIRARQPISLMQARRLAERVDMAEAVSYEAGMGGTVKYLDRTASNVIVMGNVADSAVVRGLTVKEGRFLTEAEVDGERPVCVLGHDLAVSLFPYESGLGAWVKVNDRRYQVVGSLDKMGELIFANLDYQVIIPVTRMIADFTREPDLTIAVKTGDAAILDEVQEELRWIMRTVRGVEPGEDDDFSVNNQNALLDVFGKFTAVIGTAGLSMTGLALLVGGIGIMNVMFVSVTERTREIGVRKALGAKRRAILSQFLMEAAVICLLGGVIALALAWPVTLVMQKWLPATISPTIALIALSVSAVTGIIAGFLPAWRAARLNPVDALRSE